MCIRVKVVQSVRIGNTLKLGNITLNNKEIYKRLIRVHSDDSTLSHSNCPSTPDPSPPMSVCHYCHEYHTCEDIDHPPALLLLLFMYEVIKQPSIVDQPIPIPYNMRYYRDFVTHNTIQG
jgi:hypothetical protein